MSGGAVCGVCGHDSFRMGGAVPVCASCGAPLPGAAAEIAELRRDVAAMREELTRLRQAVNFLNQRVR